MRIDRAALVAVAATVLAYIGLAWGLATVEIPADAPTALSPWIRPFRVVATLGFVLASWLHVPHLAGDFLAAILLGLVLGAVFAAVRIWGKGVGS
jgi:xanthine/uracil/vitamin C permease (AzgA family)